MIFKKSLALVLTSVIVAPPALWAQLSQAAAPDAPPQEAAVSIRNLGPSPELQKKKQEADAQAAVLQSGAGTLLRNNQALVSQAQLDMKTAAEMLALSKALNNKKIKQLVFRVPKGMSMEEARADELIEEGNHLMAESMTDMKQGGRLALAASKVNADAQKLAQAGGSCQSESGALEALAKTMFELANAFGPACAGQGSLLTGKANSLKTGAQVVAQQAAAAKAALHNDQVEISLLNSQVLLMQHKAKAEIQQGRAMLARLHKQPTTVGRGVDAQTTAQEKEEKINNLVELLKGLSDEDYQAALKRAGIEKPEASRQEAIKAGYTTMAALEYRQAEQADGDKGAQYAKSYQRLLEQDRAAVAINPDTMQETGRGWDILKQAALIALKVGVSAAIMAAGQEIKSPEQAELDGRIDDDTAALAPADAAPEKKAELHGDLGAAYEQAAAQITVTVSGDRPHPLSDDKRQRLGQLANLLQSISDEDYQGALGQVIAQIPTKGARPPLATRAGALSATYTSMAANEYDRAAQLEPSETKYAQTDERVSGEEAGAVALQPQTLQQTGWALDLLKFLGNAAINYELNGGQIYVGRSVQDQEVASVEKDLAARPLAPEKEAELRYRLGQAYEAMAEDTSAVSAPQPLDEKREVPAPQPKQEAPAVVPAPAPPAAPQAEAPAPAKSEDERLHENMQEMDSAEKSMSEELRRRAQPR